MQHEGLHFTWLVKFDLAVRLSKPGLSSQPRSAVGCSRHTGVVRRVLLVQDHLWTSRTRLRALMWLAGGKDK